MVKALKKAQASKAGINNFVVQRVSALILAAYVFTLSIFFMCCHDGSYDSWASFILSPAMRVFSIFAFVALTAHAILGMWAVITDYVKCNKTSLILQVVAVSGSVLFLVWLMDILWGNV